MVTYWGIFVWTFNTKIYKIELSHFWEDENGFWDWERKKVINLFYEIDEKTFNENNFDIKELKKKSYFLPPSSYINMIRYNPTFLMKRVHISEIRKLISNINSDNWEESTKPIITKITKAIRDEKPESEFDKIQKMIKKDAKERDRKLALETEEIFKKQALEAEKIKKIFENQASEAKEIKEIFGKQALEAKEIKGIKEMFDKIMKKLENQSLEKHDN
ncbi:15605_t:CDS:2 [Gigaspora margarita]|uniref:15605_t:CDS:1 n=1 Tax=Gigaspora margarita TaxID=4874 RepID=A0ABN7V7C7_GIGMA|nr:15605_t:CDS:2 [Gigaspora margarita]